MTNKRFTHEEMKILAQNPYVLNVSPTKIVYTLEFKKLAIERAEQGLTSVKIFNLAGFDVEMLGKARIYAALKSFKKDAASPEGLRQANVRSQEAKMAAFAKEDFSRKHTKNAICELQKKIVHLEQQIEFLKKIQSPDQ